MKGTKFHVTAVLRARVGIQFAVQVVVKFVMVKNWAFSDFADINESANKGQLKIQNISPIQVLNCCGRHQARNAILSKN